MAIERLIPEPGTYREKRVLEYPSVGDMIDALVKKDGGDATEWNELIGKRVTVKAKYPK